MNKPLNIAIYSFLLLGLYFGSATIFQSCSKEKKVPAVQNVNDQLEGLADEHSSDSFFEDDGGTYDSDNNDPTSTEGSASQTNISDDANTDAGRVDYTSPVNSDPPRSTQNNNTSYNSYSGQFMLVAGNFLVESNADAMVSKLRSQGFRSAEKVVFDLSQYYTVVAGRYGERRQANRASDDLSNRGFDNYVLKSK